MPFFRYPEMISRYEPPEAYKEHQDSRGPRETDELKAHNSLDASGSTSRVNQTVHKEYEGIGYR